MQRTVEQLLDALNAGRLETAYEALSDDCDYATPEYSILGRAAIESIDFEYFGLLSSHWRRLEHLIVAGDVVATWVTFGGVARETGKSFEMEVCNVFRFANEKIAEWRMYGDFSIARAVLS